MASTKARLLTHDPSFTGFQKGREKCHKSKTIWENFAKFDPGLFIYVRPVGGLEKHFC